MGRKINIMISEEDFEKLKSQKIHMEIRKQDDPNNTEFLTPRQLARLV